jgi:prolyl 4-hydroxylase
MTMALSSTGNGQGASVKEESIENKNRQELSPSPELVSSQSAAFPAQNAMADTNQSLAAASLAVLAAEQQQQQQQQAISAQQVLLPQQLQAPLFHPAIMTHNLIPVHMQASALAPSLLGTPGFQPAFIAPTQVFDASQPVLTVQDRPLVPPVYNGVHPHYPGLQMLHANPPVFCVDNFLTEQECNFLIHAASDCFTPAPVVGAGVGEVSPSRTSSTCYLAREDLPDYLRKVSLLTGKPVEHCELPQVGRYLPTQQYLQHFDAFDLSNADGCRFAANGGQRTVTVLVYLNDVQQGGHTAFPALNLEIKPKRGMAVVFFPATVDGLLDKMALHAALPAAEGHVKYVSQVWIRQGEYKGQPSKRLEQIMGVPFPASMAEPMTGISYPSHQG